MKKISSLDPYVPHGCGPLQVSVPPLVGTLVFVHCFCEATWRSVTYLNTV